MSSLFCLRAITWSYSRINIKSCFDLCPIFAPKLILARPECRLLCHSGSHVFRSRTCVVYLDRHGYSNKVNKGKKRNMPEKKFERLPKDVIPKNYNIRLHPDLTAFTFLGSEHIEVEVIFLLHLCN